MTPVANKRIVVKLDIKGPRVIKGIRYEGLKVVGDPYELALEYYKQGVDEIFYSDAVASLYGRNSLPGLLKKTCRDVFIPITVGGGIQTVDHARYLLSSGADKIAINTALFTNIDLIDALADEFGQQAVVVSIQCRSYNGDWECMAESGRERTGHTIRDWLNKLSSHPVGEYIINSIDQDGTLDGPDLNLLEHVQDLVNIPLIFGGGIESTSSLDKVLSNKIVSGASVASLLHFNHATVTQLKSSSSVLRFQEPAPFTGLDPSFAYSISVGVVDYGCGNLFSITNALNTIGIQTSIVSSPADLDNISVLFLPGVGSFPHAMKNLHERFLVSPIQEYAKSGRALIGICLGMQLLFTNGSEISNNKGLDLIPGSVNSISESIDFSDVPLPHIGWSTIASTSDSFTLPNLPFYFVHSFMATVAESGNILATTSYGNVLIPAIVRRKNVLGFQFHPERSSSQGLNLLSYSIHSLSSHQ